ncbi:hypothetical protein [Clostridium formicaceticum]|uniref:Uncharacterized protein n=1 Tax=Clostridium formicaceticum TaxID=1497 RepID=A0AAC9WHC6_9CLOT|nr:hypothetical protein [Clostridium formicaceticum]AOY74613.1 hypothetical protein BJL90_00760 [Clostridium formicaceticum]ARE88977.1 hypothetical protein CLFO_33830 [Clostridium formicaceticum]
MIKEDFREFLKKQGKSMGKYYISGKALGLNAINDIIKWAKGVERVFGVDLGAVVENPEETQKLLRKINLSNEVIDKRKRNFSDAVKAYFEFINGYELPLEKQDNTIAKEQ